MKTCYIDEGILLEILPNKIILKLLNREHQCLNACFMSESVSCKTMHSLQRTKQQTDPGSPLSLPRLVRCVDGHLPRLSPAAVQYDLDAAGELRGWGRGEHERNVSAAVRAYSSDVRITELTSCWCWRMSWQEARLRSSSFSSQLFQSWPLAWTTSSGSWGYCCRCRVFNHIGTIWLGFFCHYAFAYTLIISA